MVHVIRKMLPFTFRFLIASYISMKIFLLLNIFNFMVYVKAELTITLSVTKFESVMLLTQVDVDSRESRRIITY